MAFTWNRAPGGAAGGFFGLSLGTTLAAVSTWNDRRVTRRELSRLSDRELNDIGLRRSDIETVVSALR